MKSSTLNLSEFFYFYAVSFGQKTFVADPSVKSWLPRVVIVGKHTVFANMLLLSTDLTFYATVALFMLFLSIDSVISDLKY